MKILASLLLLGVSALPVNTPLEEEIVPLTAEDIEKKRSPVFFAVHRVGRTGLSIDFALTKPAGLAAEVGPYQLCVFNRPVALADLPGQLGQPGLLVRTEVVRKERATFDLRREEIPNSALLVYLANRSPAGARNVQAFCLPLAELMKTVRLDHRHPLTASDGPSAA